MEIENIQINNDGLTGRLCNPYQHPDGEIPHHNSKFWVFEREVKSYPVITDTPLVPGSVHKANLVWQFINDHLQRWATLHESRKVAYDNSFEIFTSLFQAQTRQAYQLIEEPKSLDIDKMESKLSETHNKIINYKPTQEKPQFKTAEEILNEKAYYITTISPYQHRQVLEAMEEYKQQEDKTEWISVNDLLPEDGQEVNILLNSLNVKISTFRINNGYKSFYCGDRYNMSYSGVTHWMPLPTSPTK